MNKSLFTIIIIILLVSGYALLKPQTEPRVDEDVPAGDTESVSDEDHVSQEAVDNTLDLSNQQLEALPQYVFDQTYLEELDVSHNNLTGALQAEIRHLTNLKVLNVSDNSMTGVPAEIGQLQNLEALDLSNNKLTGLPHELGNLKNLKVLNISGNEYSEFDLSIIEENLPEGVEIIR